MPRLALLLPPPLTLLGDCLVWWLTYVLGMIFFLLRVFVLLTLLCAPAVAGEPRASVVINAVMPVAHIYARRALSSDRLASLKNGARILLIDECRNRNGSVIVKAWGPEFGLKGGAPAKIKNLWCAVSHQVQGSDEISMGWMLGQYLRVKR